MDRAIDLLETERKALNISRYKLLKNMGVNWDTATYSKAMNGVLKTPKTWLPGIAKFLKMPLEELQQLREQECIAGGPVKFSAEELHEYAKIVEGVGYPLTLNTLQKIKKERGDSS